MGVLVDLLPGIFEVTGGSMADIPGSNAYIHAQNIAMQEEEARRDRIQSIRDARAERARKTRQEMKQAKVEMSTERRKQKNIRISTAAAQRGGTQMLLRGSKLRSKSKQSGYGNNMFGKQGLFLQLRGLSKGGRPR